VLADVFEAVVAAVYMDSGHNMAAVWHVLRKLYAPLFAGVRGTAGNG
jgi:dsRNA-specific ribonuclease